MSTRAPYLASLCVISALLCSEGARAEPPQNYESSAAMYHDLARKLKAVDVKHPIRAARRDLAATLREDTLLGLPPVPWAVDRAERRLKRLEGAGASASEMDSFEALMAKSLQAQPLFEARVFSDMHLLNTMLPLFEGMTDAGAMETEVKLKGNRHSQRQSAIRAARRQSLRVLEASPGTSHAEYLKVVRTIINEARGNPGAKFLVLGHGGKLHAMLTHAVLKGAAPADLTQRLVVVETTAKGKKRMARYMRRQISEGTARNRVEDLFPYVDIGDHWAKTNYESPSIGLGCAFAMQEHLQGMVQRKILSEEQAKRPVLVWGYGNVGRQTARYLKSLGYEVHVYDKRFTKDKGLRRRASRDGVIVHRREWQALAARVGTIAAATGSNPLKGSVARRIRHQTVVFNLASPGELDGLVAASIAAPSGRTTSGALRQMDVPDDHHDRALRIGERDVFLARGGQVINLAAGWTVPPRLIQITRGLAWQAVLKAWSVLGKPGGRYHLSDAEVRSYLGAIDRELALHQMGSLLRPSTTAFRQYVHRQRSRRAPRSRAARPIRKR